MVPKLKKYGMILTLFEPTSKNKNIVQNVVEQVFIIFQQIASQDLFKTGYGNNVTEKLWASMKQGKDSNYWIHFQNADLVVHHKQEVTRW